MNRRSPATALLAVLVLVAIAMLSPVSAAVIKKGAPSPRDVASPAIDLTEDSPVGAPTTIVTPIPNPLPIPQTALLALHDGMRHLWMDHIVSSRVLTMSIFSDLKGVDAYKDRLELNVVDLTDLMVPYIGKENAVAFADLFTRHVALTSDVLQAQKSGNMTLFRSASYDWYQNADEIASFLCKINPAWDYAEMQNLWKMHLDTVVDEALDYQKGDYQGDVMCYDAAQDHVFNMADYLSNGLYRRITPSK